MRLSLPFSKLSQKANAVAKQLPYLPQSSVLEENHTPDIMRSFIRLISIATIGFIVWAAFTKVNEIARADGEVVPSGYVRTVQHLEGGIVRDIRVKEGDLVKAGDILVVLEGAGAAEDVAELRSKRQFLALQAERLQAFVGDRKPDFESIKAKPAMVRQQQEIFKAMKEARMSEVAVVESQIKQKEQEIAMLADEYAMFKNNAALAREARNIQKALLADGLTSRSLYLQRQEEVNSQQGKFRMTQEKAEKAEDALQEYRDRLKNVHARHRDQAMQMLDAIQSELAQNKESLQKLTKRVERLKVRAPYTGYVKGLTIRTLGGVVASGQTLLEIVPIEEQLMVEVRLSPKHIGHVRSGQPVQVKVDAYDYTRYGILPGTLEFISATTFIDEYRQAYYRGRVRLHKHYLGDDPKALTLLPGMTVDADIVMGKKTILTYLLKPIHAASSTALTEK